MRKLAFILFGTALLLPVTTAANSANVLAATATSSAPSSSAITCLLKPGCTGSWKPGSADSGANEGVYVQFEAPVEADTVELETSAGATDAFILAVNGAPAPPSTVMSPAHAANGRYAARYQIPGGLIKSMFFRLGVRKGGWRNFSLYSIRFYRQGTALDLAVPVLAPGTVTASSVLEPRAAYQPANLFDSRYDFAWATNGHATKGRGETIEIKFRQPQNLAGMMVWNGYQRSEEHFKANGRVTKISVSDGKVSASFPLGDKMGGQKITFANPMKDVALVKLTIDDIAPGAKYPDVLLSELRFINDRNQILIPDVRGMTPEASPLTEAILDRSLSSVVCSSSLSPGDFQRSLRLRRDGSFVIYGKAHDQEHGKKSDQVLEGSWELRGSVVRIFGKRYAETVIRNEYSRTARKIPPSIFQSDLKITRFQDLPADEKRQLAALILTRVGALGGEADGVAEKTWGVDGRMIASGTNEGEYAATEKALGISLVKSLDSMNPWTISSPILADAMLPSDDLGACGKTF